MHRKLSTNITMLLRICLCKNPDTTLVKYALPRCVIDAYCRELRGNTLPALGSRCAAMFGATIATHVLVKYFNIIISLVSYKLF
ncbi:hypothetical protein N9L68_02995 [bacterium]|nr:hypothetical protein [bacterium]